jgi:hypothetical protein
MRELPKLFLLIIVGMYIMLCSFLNSADDHEKRNFGKSAPELFAEVKTCIDSSHISDYLIYNCVGFSEQLVHVQATQM